MRKPKKSRTLTIQGRETYPGMPLERELDRAYNAEISIEANSPIIFEDENVDEEGSYTVKPEYNIRTDKLELMGTKASLSLQEFEVAGAKKRAEAKAKAEQIKAAQEAE